VHDSLTILAETGVVTISPGSIMAGALGSDEALEAKLGGVANDSDMLDAVCRDALMALVLQATEHELRRAALVACAANGVPPECAEVVAAGVKAALDEVVAGDVA
jgi:hypothetical protein